MAIILLSASASFTMQRWTYVYTVYSIYCAWGVCALPKINLSVWICIDINVLIPAGTGLEDGRGSEDNFLADVTAECCCRLFNIAWISSAVPFNVIERLRWWI